LTALIRFIQEDIDITLISDDRFVGLGNPMLHSITTDDSGRNVCGFLGAGDTSKAFLYDLHGSFNPFSKGLTGTLDLIHDFVPRIDFEASEYLLMTDA